jgi:HlyD family secretion protein
MDIQRPELLTQRRRKRYIAFGIGVVLLAAVTLGLGTLKPAAPVIERSAVWIDTVKRGPMLRQVRGSGTLVPENTRWIAAVTEGRVDRVIVHPGTTVTRDTIIVELSNPEVEQSARDAELQLRAAVADIAQREAQLQSEFLNQRAEAARVKADFTEAQMRAAVDEDLAGAGLTSSLTLKLSKSRAEELKTRNEIETERLRVAARAGEAQLAAQRARVDQLRALNELRAGQMASLHVRSGIDGVLQQVAVEVGQRISPGATIARVAQPEPLMAQLRIPETQMRDVAAGQSVAVDTRNGIVAGRVSRIDPASHEGSVTVDVALDGALPKGARPDLTVDGTIELERLDDVLYVGRPVQANEGESIGLFRLSPDEKEATRTTVAVGRASVNAIEIHSGLAAGDKVILSDMSAWDKARRIRIQ